MTVSWLEWMDHTEDDFYDGPDLRRLTPPSEQDTAKRAPRDVGERPGRAQLDLGRHGTPAGTGRPTRAKIDERRVRQELYGARGLVASSTVRPPVAEDAS